MKGDKMGILTDEQTKSIIDGAIDKIKDAVVKQATEEAVWACKRSIASSVDEIVQKFIREEVAPEILTSLQERKSVLIEAAIANAAHFLCLSQPQHRVLDGLCQFVGPALDLFPIEH